MQHENCEQAIGFATIRAHSQQRLSHALRRWLALRRGSHERPRFVREGWNRAALVRTAPYEIRQSGSRRRLGICSTVRRNGQQTDSEHFDFDECQSSIPTAVPSSIDLAGEIREGLTDCAKPDAARCGSQLDARRQEAIPLTA